ncbi:hypothetical protein EYF80_032932 [Liparis tanakae]|uniref:Uncharacterized protein n=1 Tax=Liparis tanakae TaxID=230148 RepID=A0A4Z2GTJ5_9TELE|nr:hypothetical protein EYF80_032932 [Liparis tanakae]
MGPEGRDACSTSGPRAGCGPFECNYGRKTAYKSVELEQEHQEQQQQPGCTQTSNHSRGQQRSFSRA